MENWKDVPHLFANGKFKFVRKNGQIETIIGCRDHRYYIYDDMTHEPNGMGTLIARKIEDMTDEEILSIAANVRGKPSEIRQRWIDEADINPDNLSFGLVRHLLSCGVYPGPQSHFKPQITEFQNGEKHVNPAPVIDISKL